MTFQASPVQYSSSHNNEGSAESPIPSLISVKPDVKKIFVLDTNVILHDPACIRQFAEHDVALPITVLEELDRFKKGHEDIHAHARQFLREVDELTGDLLSPDGAPLGEGLGRIRVLIVREKHPQTNDVFFQDSADHRILNAALEAQNSARDRLVVLVTKDTNLRVKAKALGLIAQDYETDKIESFDQLYPGKRVISNLPAETVDLFYHNGGRVDALALPEVKLPVANENFVLRNGSRSALATYCPGERLFQRVEKATAYGITARNAEQAFAMRGIARRQRETRDSGGESR